MSPDEGFTKKWYSSPLEYSGDTMLMPVPASYNDITTDSKLRKTHFKFILEHFHFYLGISIPSERIDYNKL